MRCIFKNIEASTEISLLETRVPQVKAECKGMR